MRGSVVKQVCSRIGGRKLILVDGGICRDVENYAGFAFSTTRQPSKMGIYNLASPRATRGVSEWDATFDTGTVGVFRF